jgi:hypothetical protein
MAFRMDLRKYPSLIVLVIANLVPLLGVYAWGWSVAELLFMYWTESAIIGFFNVLKMALARGPMSGELSVRLPLAGASAYDTATPPGALAFKLFAIPFFIVHYGIFMAAHLAFLVAFFLESFSFGLALAAIAGSAALFASHGISFVLNYLGKKEYLKAGAGSLMAAPYPRIVLMQFVLILGAIIGAPILVFVPGKILFDAFAHLMERKHFA